MEAKLVGRDYVPDGAGGFVRLWDDEAVLARVLFKLTARRGAFPFLPALGSRLYLLLRQPPSARAAAARQYAAEALSDEADLTVESVTYSPVGEDSAAVEVCLSRGGKDYTVGVTVT